MDHSDEEREAMNEESSWVTLSSITERISRLENDVRELRELVRVQKSYELVSLHKTSFTPLNSDLSRSPAVRPDSWEVACLGKFSLRSYGREPPPCGSRRARSILKYLLGRPGYAASSEALIECFWPLGDPAAGARSLQVAIHALRSSLRGFGPKGSNETVLFGNNGYSLNPALSIVQDVDRFRDAYERGQDASKTGHLPEAKQAFEEARALYTGDYLPDCYEEWASGKRLALQDIRIALLAQLAPLYSQEEGWEAAISCYLEILDVDGYREDIYRQLMRSYAACGRQADVKRTYHACLERLRRDLRLAPASETTTLYQRLIQQETPLEKH
jgi:DNA-binding SARP family transcriptional activator